MKINTESLDGFMLGICIGCVGFASYLIITDMRDKGYQVVPFDEGVKNFKSMITGVTLQDYFKRNDTLYLDNWRLKK